MKELFQQYDLLKQFNRCIRTTFCVLYSIVALPYFYNLGSAEIGCAIYEVRTDSLCFDILGHRE